MSKVDKKKIPKRNQRLKEPKTNKKQEREETRKFSRWHIKQFSNVLVLIDELFGLLYTKNNFLAIKMFL